MKTIAALLAAGVLLAGCSSSSDDEPAREKASADASRQLDRGALKKQADAQAEQLEAAKKKLEERVKAEAERAEAETGVVIDIGLHNGRKPTPQGERVKAKIGQKITLRVTSAIDEELHVHSDPEHTFAVKPGKGQLFSFTIDTPGQVAVEAHHAGVTIVQLVVRP